MCQYMLYITYKANFCALTSYDSQRPAVSTLVAESGLLAENGMSSTVVFTLVMLKVVVLFTKFQFCLNCLTVGRTEMSEIHPYVIMCVS